MIVTGTELFEKCNKVLQNPKASRIELEHVLHDLNQMLNTSFSENDEHISTLYFAIGGCLNKMGMNALAIAAFEKAVEKKPDFVEAYNNLGYVYKKFNFHEEAKALFKKVIDMIEDPNCMHPIDEQSRSEFYTNYGSMFVCNGTPEIALEYFEKADKLSSKNIQNTYNKGLAQIEMGDYENGFRGYDVGDRPDRVINRHYGHSELPFWDGTKGKKIVVIGEQGIGDELMFATIIPDVAKDCEIVLDAHPRLADMFRRSFPNIDVYGTRKDITDEWGKNYPLDAKILIGSLAKFYRKKESDFPKLPYLVVDAKYDKRYGQRLNEMGTRPKIGISWRGGTKQTGRNHRYIPLEEWLEILNLDCDFISLQYDYGIQDKVEEFNRWNNVRIHHWPEMLEDYEQTAALVKNLDLVISVPQSVVHLSGAIGTTLTWQLCPVKTLWQGGVYGHDMPWYPNVVNYWQDKDGDELNWKPTLKKVKEDLCRLLQPIIEN